MDQQPTLYWWILFGILAVGATLYALMGANRATITPHEKTPAEKHAELSQRLAERLDSCTTISTYRDNELPCHFPNSPQGRRMALAAFDMGAVVVLRGGSLGVDGVVFTPALMAARLAQQDPRVTWQNDLGPGPDAKQPLNPPTIITSSLIRGPDQTFGGAMDEAEGESLTDRNTRIARSKSRF